MFFTSKRFWKRFGYTVGILLAIVIVLYGCLSLWANRKLAPRLAKLRAAGEPTSIAELKPQPAEGTDAQEILARLQPAIKASEKDYANFFKTDVGKAFEVTEESGQPPSPEAIAAMEEILDRYPEIFSGLHEACAADYFHPDLDYAADFQAFLQQLIDKGGDLRQCVRLLRWQAIVALSHGDSAAALEAGLLGLKISRLQEERPALVSGLVAVAIRHNGCDILNRTLRSGSFSTQRLEQLNRELARYDELDWFVRCLETERAINLSGAADLFHFFPMTWQGTLFQSDVIDYYDALLPLAAKPLYLSSRDVHALSAKFGSIPISNALIELLFPAMQAAQVSANHNLALIRSLRILTALQAYEAENGERAAGLEQLPLSSSEVEDPFSGKPLHLKWTDDGWVIYSVGQNGIDDKGKLARQEDIGLSPLGYNK